jgi:hypothetical protein
VKVTIDNRIVKLDDLPHIGAVIREAGSRGIGPEATLLEQLFAPEPDMKVLATVAGIAAKHRDPNSYNALLGLSSVKDGFEITIEALDGMERPSITYSAVFA